MVIIEACNSKIELPIRGRKEKEVLMQNYGWLITPLIEKLGSYEKAIRHLNWKIYIK